MEGGWGRKGGIGLAILKAVCMHHVLRFYVSLSNWETAYSSISDSARPVQQPGHLCSLLISRQVLLLSMVTLSMSD